MDLIRTKKFPLLANNETYWVKKKATEKDYKDNEKTKKKKSERNFKKNLVLNENFSWTPWNNPNILHSFLKCLSKHGTAQGDRQIFDKSTMVNEARSGQGQVVFETTETMLMECCVFVFTNGLCWFLAWWLRSGEGWVKIIAMNGRYDEDSKFGKGQPNKEIVVTG